MKDSCLIIGGNGFIGKNLIIILIEKGYDVYVVDKFIHNLISIKSDSLFLIEADISNNEVIINIAQKVTTVVWLIHTTVPSTSMDDIENDLKSNIYPLVHFILGIKNNIQITKFIYLSSGGTIYGDPVIFQPIKEDQDTQPISSYGLTKLIAEKYINFLFSDSHIKPFILRPSNVYGEYQNLDKPQGIIGHLFKAYLQEYEIDVFGDGNNIRDYIHVKDLCVAIALCVELKVTESKITVLNIGSETGVSISEMINMVSSVVGKPILYKVRPSRGYDCRYNVLSIDRAKGELEWSPYVNLYEGLESFWLWIKEIQL